MKAVYRARIEEGTAIVAVTEGDPSGEILAVLDSPAHSKAAAALFARLRSNHRATLGVTPRWCPRLLADGGVTFEAEEVKSDAWTW